MGARRWSPRIISCCFILCICLASPAAARILDLPPLVDVARDSPAVSVEPDLSGTRPVLIRRGPATFEVALAWHPAPGEHPSRVFAAGDWNGWKEGATPLDWNGEAGRYETTLPLPRGRHAYKLVVDGAWRENPDAPARSADPFGGFNSLALAGEPAEPPRLLPLSRVESTAEVVYRLAALDGRTLEGLLVREGEKPQRGIAEEAALRFTAPKASGWVGFMAWDAAGALAPPLVRFEGATAENPLARTLYFAIIDRFMNGVRENDAPVPDPRLHRLANYLGGDLEGLGFALDEGYFERLGIDALWVSPPFEGPAKAYADALPPHRLFSGYHGYWPLTLSRIDPRLGTAAALRRLADRARAKGMLLLLDVVFKHVHEESDLPRRHPEWFGSAKLPDGRANIRLYDEHPLTTWFDAFLPAFDFGNAACRTHLAAEGAALRAKYGLDGFRLDAVKHIPAPFFAELRRALEAAGGKPPLLLGETIADRATITSYIGPDLLDGQFDFPLYHAIVPALATESRGMNTLLASLDASAREYPPGAVMSNLLGNHDFPRFLAYADGDVAENEDGRERAYDAEPVAVDRASSHEKLRLAFSLLFSLRGVPLVYYGDELGMTGAGDPDNRRMFEGPKPKTAEARKTFDTVARLTRLRRASPALVQGATAPLLAAKERMAFLRLDFDERVLCLFSRDAKGPFAMTLPEGLAGATRAVDLATGETFAVKEGALAPPVGVRSARMLRLE